MDSERESQIIYGLLLESSDDSEIGESSAGDNIEDCLAKSVPSSETELSGL